MSQDTTKYYNPQQYNAITTLLFPSSRLLLYELHQAPLECIAFDFFGPTEKKTKRNRNRNYDMFALFKLNFSSKLECLLFLEMIAPHPL